MKEVRQCPSCGGFCKKSGCERTNVEPELTPAELRAGIALQLREIERLRERDAEIAGLRETLADSHAYVERLKQRIDELIAARAALGDKT